MSEQRIGEWTFRLYKAPPGMVIERPGQSITFAHTDLLRLWETPVTLIRYTGIPRYLYKNVLRKGAEALGKWVSDEDLRRRVPPVYKPVKIRIPEKPEWEKELDEADEELEEDRKELRRQKRWLEDVEKLVEEVE